MKKKGILILLVLLFIVVMIGCKAESQPQDEAPQATASDQVEPTAPIESDEPAAKVGEVQPMAARTNLTQEELMGYFEAAYNAGQIYASIGYDENSLIEQELKELSYFVEDGTSNWPDDVYDQYRAWREANYPQEPATEAPSSNPQTKPVQQAPSTTNNNQQVGGAVDPVDEAHHFDPTQSSVFEPMDDPWAGQAQIDYGGTGSDYDESHHGSDPSQSSFFKIPDDPWSSNAKIDYGGD